MITLEELRTLDLFEELDDEALAGWQAVALERPLRPGDVTARQGELVEGLTLLLEGELDGTIALPDGRTEPTGVNIAPTWAGALSAMTDTPLGVTMSARTPCRTYLIPREAFVDLTLSHRTVHRRIMQVVFPVANRITAMSANRERLEALGTMAAGLAHELNNPAAAARRAASDLAVALDTLGSTLHRFVDSRVSLEDASRLADLQAEALRRAAGRSALDALDAADAEDELLDVLEGAGVPDAWKLAEPLATAGLDAAWVEGVVAVGGAATAAALEWVAASLTAAGLVEELRESTDRMSKLVGAVKTYAYMDRGEVVEVDLHEGLETTLVVLGHKLKHSAITIAREYDRAIPKLMVHGSELNQVWTNVLDNAIDALAEQGGGTITLSSRRDGSCVEVLIADDGPGIPPDVVPRVFDPFFTTKGVGAGTGMGLDTARRIVVDRHKGSLTVQSKPGRTAFTVRLPLDAG